MLICMFSVAALWQIIFGQFNQCESTRTVSSNQLQFECLEYYTESKDGSSQEDAILIKQMIAYCIRPVKEIRESTLDVYSMGNNAFTFEELRGLNITPQQLLEWSAPVNIVEQYLIYITQSRNDISSSSEVFYNCTSGRFGSKCQYSFHIHPNMSFDNVVKNTFARSWAFSWEFVHKITNLSCYMHLKCNRGGPPLCLDWREICDGRIDCIGDGADEAHCFEMEINECAEDEYRCHNGLCIPRDFRLDDINNPDCLDRSDESDKFVFSDSYTPFCYIDPTFRCEEHACHPGNRQFKCGDGECVEDFSYCMNGRTEKVKESIAAKRTLSYVCQAAMICETDLKPGLDDTLDDFCADSFSLAASLSMCEPVFQFPSIPIVLGHIRFLFLKSQIQQVKATPVPDYVCFDENLCPSIQSTFIYRNLTCQSGDQIRRNDHTDRSNIIRFILSVRDYFRGCLTTYMNESWEQYRQHLSLYCCRNSSKCISNHRLLDGIQDCQMGDDEQYEFSCSLNDIYRFKCDGQENRCLSPILDRSVCNSKAKLNFDEIVFEKICDGSNDFLPQEIDGQYYTDETECDHWPCSNIYSRCDGVKACSDWHDEHGCIESNCAPSTIPCVSPVNLHLICLPHVRVNDGITDCLGGSDELQFCQPLSAKNRFRCSNETKCISSSDLCNSVEDCITGDDELFCNTNKKKCSDRQNGNPDDPSYIFCQLFYAQKFHFSLNTSYAYPSHNMPVIRKANEKFSGSQVTFQNIKFGYDDSKLAWYCNRGIYARFWNGTDDYSHVCFYPPSYYGDTCQYQNQRVSLTLRLLPIDRRSIYAIVTTLMDEDSQIHSYEQFIFAASWGCKVKFNIYLLYSTRPKNASKIYSVRIDAFNKETLKYFTSWHLQIPFPFLPVNRLAAQLTLPVQQLKTPNFCNLTCYNNGQCMKYENSQKFFCQCNVNWSGNECEKPVYCGDCSADSICVGSVNHRSICICPLNKVGPRCLIETSLLKECKNNGRYVPVSISTSTNNYICICTEEYYGPNCEYLKRKLKISFLHILVPSHILVYIITVSQRAQPVTIVRIKKLIHGEHSVTFHILKLFHMVFIKFTNHYYLAVVQQSPNYDIFTTINPTQRCNSILKLLNSTLLALPLIRRVKYYHLLCRDHSDLRCFYDEFYMCLCTVEHHANCFKFDHNTTLQCQKNGYCMNDASCFQDHPTCPTSTICVCTDCYFGTQCQFYAKGFGLTLDDILRYEIRNSLPFSEQKVSVKFSAIITSLILLFGLTNSIFSYLTFRRPNVRHIGCGLYLAASSITSVLTLCIFTIKFLFLIFSQMDLIMNHIILYLGCLSIEFLLKVSLYTNNWLHACVSIERSVTIYRGVYFNKKKSKRLAKWMIRALPLIITMTFIHEPIHRNLFNDEEEQRILCVSRYSHLIQNYSTAIIFFHFLVPFLINLCSALFIIVNAATQRSAAQNHHTYRHHLYNQFAKHKHMVISSIVLAILALPRLIISFISNCVKSSRDPWLLLAAYYISFTPSALIFIVFILPSDFYTTEFKDSIKTWRRNY